MEDKDLKDLEMSQLITYLAQGYEALEGCSRIEARAGVYDFIKDSLIKEIEWVGEMLEK